MKDRTVIALALSSLFVACGLVAAAQDATPPAPPKVLVIDREYLKPGKGGSQHAITEGAFVRAAKAANWSEHYIAMDSMSGPNRALFLFPYDSFEAWGKDALFQTSGAFGAANDAALIADGELLSRSEAHAYLYHPEMSLHIGMDISKARFWQFQSFRLKPGHDMDWADLVKIYTDGFANIPAANWAMYESQFAEDNGGVWVSITPMKTLGEVDSGIADGGKFWEGLSAANKKRIEDLAAACIESSQRNVFVVNPSESYEDPSWDTSAPEIWGQH